MPVSFNKSLQNEEAFFPETFMARACFQVSQTGNIVSSVRFLFQDADYTYATQQGILTKIRPCEHLQKFCKHEQASTHLIFASNSNKGIILRALSNWVGPFYTPIFVLTTVVQRMDFLYVQFGGFNRTTPRSALETILEKKKKKKQARIYIMSFTQEHGTFIKSRHQQHVICIPTSKRTSFEQFFHLDYFTLIRTANSPPLLYLAASWFLGGETHWWRDDWIPWQGIEK